jgi:hypothetical protein
MVYIFYLIYWSQNIKHVGVRPARHPAGGFIESRKAGLDESSSYV